MAANFSKEKALERISSIEKYCNDEVKLAKGNVKKYSSYNPEDDVNLISKMCIRIKQTIADLTPTDSEYRKLADSINQPFDGNSYDALKGYLEGLGEDYKNDYLKGFNEMIDADIFTDILDQAKDLLSMRYVRASAVVAGVALETHLRKLAERNSISIMNDDGKYIKAEALNSELHKNNIIDKTLNKHISSWLGLRNDAAHPGSKGINKGLVDIMISGIRLFIEKYPA